MLYNKNIKPRSDGNYDSTLSVYPNPTDNEITIEWKGHVINRISVYSITGHKVLSRTIDNINYTLSLGDQNQGIYIINILDSIGNTEMKKIILR